MADVFFEVKSTKTNREVPVTKDFGSSLQESIQIFGEDQVFRQFQRMCQTDVSNKVRALLNDPEVSTDAVLKSVEDWKPGQRAVGSVTRDPMTALKNGIESGRYTEDQLEEIRALLRARKK